MSFAYRHKNFHTNWHLVNISNYINLSKDWIVGPMVHKLTATTTSVYGPIPIIGVGKMISETRLLFVEYMFIYNMEYEVTSVT